MVSMEIDFRTQFVADIQFEGGWKQILSNGKF